MHGIINQACPKFDGEIWEVIFTFQHAFSNSKLPRSKREKMKRKEGSGDGGRRELKWETKVIR